MCASACAVHVWDVFLLLLFFSLFFLMSHLVVEFDMQGERSTSYTHGCVPKRVVCRNASLLYHETRAVALHSPAGTPINCQPNICWLAIRSKRHTYNVYRYISFAIQILQRSTEHSKQQLFGDCFGWCGVVYIDVHLCGAARLLASSNSRLNGNQTDTLRMCAVICSILKHYLKCTANNYRRNRIPVQLCSTPKLCINMYKTRFGLWKLKPCQPFPFRKAKNPNTHDSEKMWISCKAFCNNYAASVYMTNVCTLHTHTHKTLIVMYMLKWEKEVHACWVGGLTITSRGEGRAAGWVFYDVNVKRPLLPQTKHTKKTPPSLRLLRLR